MPKPEISFFSYIVDPCNDNIYVVLNDPKRNKDYDGEPSRCDSSYYKNWIGDWQGPDEWYRFAGQAGTQLANGHVDRNHCGASKPGWLQGEHPVLTLGETVTRQVCFSVTGRSPPYICTETNVVIKQCGGFYVYNFGPVRSCISKFCGQ